MEYSFDVTKLLKTKDGIVKIESKNYSGTRSPQLNEIIDSLGMKSMIAQKLPGIITNASKFWAADNTLYLVVAENRVAGFLKVGKKKLFHNLGSRWVEINPLCLLDFYVHESCQRGGMGKRMMDHMLNDQRLEAHQIGYDKLTNASICFLRKHYHLIDYVPQSNNFIVYNKYFQTSDSNKSKRPPRAETSFGNKDRVNEKDSFLHDKEKEPIGKENSKVPQSIVNFGQTRYNNNSYRNLNQLSQINNHNYLMNQRNNMGETVYGQRESQQNVKMASRNMMRYGQNIMNHERYPSAHRNNSNNLKGILI